MQTMAIDKLHNGYWLSHRLLGSKAKVVYGSVYAIPATIGPVEISVLGCILLHLRDPFLALESASKLTTEAITVAEPFNEHNPKGMYLNFLPDPSTSEPKVTWWEIRPEWVIRALGVLGFGNTEVTYHTQRNRDQFRKLYTIVGKRKCAKALTGAA